MSCSNCCDSNDITLPEGSDGVGISSITLNGSNQLVITYSDNTTTTTSAITINATGTNVLHNDTTAQSESIVDAAAASAIGTFTYTIPAATVTTNGSYIRATAWFSIAASTTGIIKYTINIDGIWYSAAIPNGAQLYGDINPSKTKFVLEIHRVSNTTVMCSCHFENYTDSINALVPSSSGADFELTPGALGAINFTTTGIVLAPYAYYYFDGGGGETASITVSQFVVEHFKK
jgi:hypothetical protein